MKKTAVIIGAGMGGLCTALALQQLGYDIKVYERTPRLEKVGAGLTLWGNAIRALTQLAVGEKVVQAGQKMVQGGIFNPAGQPLSYTHMATIEREVGYPAVAIHRGDLQAILSQAVGGQHIFTGHELVQVNHTAPRVTARFANGAEVVGDILVGADGLHSAVRRHILPHVPRRYSGYSAWRGVAPLSELKIELGHSFEAWGRGERFGMLRLNQHQLYWFATKNSPPGRKPTPAESKAELFHRFGHWFQPIPQAISATPAEAILYNDIWDIPPQPMWHSGRVVLVGDAIHATTPNMGQGGCMAIESALALQTALRRFPQDFPAALNHYTTLQQPRTTFVTNQSWQIGRVGQWHNELACWARDTAVRLTPASLLSQSLIQFLKG